MNFSPKTYTGLHNENVPGAPRDASEIEREMASLNQAHQRLQNVLNLIGERLQAGGVLASLRPESAEGIKTADAPCESGLGTQIRNVRNDLHCVADDFERLLSRLAV